MTAWRVHTATLYYSLLAALPQVESFMDIGSLDGRESFAVEERFPHIHCIAFEPNPRNIQLIESEIARRHSRINLETIALGNTNGTTSFYTRIPVGSQNYGASSLLQFASADRNEEFATDAIEVPLQRLDTFDKVQKYRKLALWIDVEGAGYYVLEGMKEIADKVQLVHIEVETRSLFENGKLAPDIIQLMQSYGFDLIGSNLDRHFQRQQGDLVFLRKRTLSRKVVQRAMVRAALLERFAIQRLAINVLPPKVYRAGRDWLVQHIK